MSSRAEQKAARRAAREAAEAAARQAATRKSRMQLALSGLVAAAAIAGAITLFQSSGGPSAPGPSGGNPGVTLPPVRDVDLAAAAKSAGCTLKSFSSDGQEHTTEPVQYKTNPPTSGNHNPMAAADGIYEVGNVPAVGNAVHALEHGRVELQYRPGTSRPTVDKLETLGSEALSFDREAYHLLVFENQTRMRAAVAASAWTKSLTCPALNDSVYDAVRAFRKAYTDKGPELIP